jgi:radical SAM superfamily enzyme YgiQ (UPF0313 family)
MRVLLIKPFQRMPALCHSPPLGLLYIASTLRQRFGPEVDVRLLDMKVLGLPPEWLAGHLDELRPDVVGVSSFNCEAGAALRVAEVVKAWSPKTLTALGGPYAHRRAAEILGQSSFDWVVGGPGDHVFPDALERRFGGQELGTDLPGVSWQHDGDIHVAPESDVIKDLDSLPLPAWDLVDFDLYARKPTQMAMLKGKRYAPLFTSRGCPYKCNYCHDLFGKRFYHRSPDSVLEEIELLRERYDVDEFQIVDDIFNLHKPRLKKIMGEVSTRWPGQTHFCFPNGLRADILNESVLDALKAGGTYGMAIAIETVTERLQKLVEKNLDVDKALAAINGADDRGMAVSGFFMLGFPTETPQEIQNTIDFALRSKLTIAHFFAVVPQPETPLYPLAERENAVALKAAVADEQEGNAYRSLHSWYERAYGYPLAKKMREANVRFYLAPSRMARILKRVPPVSLAKSAFQFGRVILRRNPSDETIARPE